MEGSKGFRKFAYRWLIRQHYKRRILIRLCPKRTLERKFKQKLGYWPDLENPKTFNEKLSWFKLYVRDPLTTKCADKYAVREYVKEKIGGAHLVPLLGVYDRVEDIDLDELPEEFVLKPNHESGRVILCHDKSKIDWRKQADVMKNWLRENYYYQTGEWQYKDIPPKILCEKMLHGEVTDYRFFCFCGEPFGVKITGGGRVEGHSRKIAFCSLDFDLIKMTDEKNNPIDENMFEKPPHWNEMVRIARVLSQDFPFVRVDLYDLEGKVYFGELTFTPADGMDKYLPDGWDRKLGEQYDFSLFWEEFKQSGQVICWHRQAKRHF